MTGLGLGGTGLGPYYSFLGPYINSCGQSVTGLGLGGSGNIYLRVGECTIKGCRPLMGVPPSSDDECTIKGCRPELVILDHGTPPPPPRSFTRPLAYSYPLQSSSITVLRPLHLHNLHWCPQTSPTRRQARPHAGPARSLREVRGRAGLGGESAGGRCSGAPRTARLGRSESNGETRLGVAGGGTKNFGGEGGANWWRGRRRAFPAPSGSVPSSGSVRWAPARAAQRID